MMQFHSIHCASSIKSGKSWGKKNPSQILCSEVKLLISSFLCHETEHDLVHEFSFPPTKCLVCRPSYEALLHVGTQQERVD